MIAHLESVKGYDITLVSPEELIEFRSEFEARAFLEQYIYEPFNLATFRQALADELGFFFVSRMTDYEVIEGLAQRMVNTCVAFARLDILPTAVTGATEADLLTEILEALEEVSEELEKEFEDLKPKAIIPPEFPRLAKIEGDSIEDQGGRFANRLDLLRFVGLDGADVSAIAKDLLGVTNASANALRDGSGGLGSRLIALVSGTLGLSKNSQVAQALGKAVNALGRGMSGGVELLEGKLRDALRGKMGDRAASAVAKVLTTAVGGQVRAIGDTTKGLGDTLSQIAGKTGSKVVKGATQVGQAIGKAAGTQGKAIKDAAGDFGGGLKRIGELPPGAAGAQVAANVVKLWLERADSTPLAGENFELVLPDGSKKRGTIGRDGSAQVTGLPAGRHSLVFPMLEWPWKVVGGRTPTITIYTVKSGDSLSKIAKQFNISSWPKLYDHPCNGSFRKLRPNPNLIHPGDKIFIPSGTAPDVKVEPGKEYRLRLIDPFNQEQADDDRIWIKYVVQKTDTLSKIGKAHGVEWRKDIYDHAKNADFKKKRSNPDVIEPEDIIYIPVPNGPFVRYEVQIGNWLSRIGAAHGVDWRSDIYNHQKNADFKKKRPNPDAIFPGDVLWIPLQGGPVQPEETGSFVRYVVQPCDYMERIGEAFAVDWLKDIYNHPKNAEFKELRPNPKLIHPGDVLWIPAPTGAKPSYKQEFVKYEVVSGDWLSKIAARYGVDWRKDIYEHPANAKFKFAHPNPDLIYPGDKLCIPVKSAATWVMFTVLDERGKPVPEVVIKVRGSDNKIRQATSNAQGVVEFKDMPPGSFEVVDMDDDEGFEVTDLSEQR